jgi:hypothetical protein
VLELAVRLREPEVRDLDLAVTGDEHVGRRHVAVDDAELLALRVDGLVRVREALADLQAHQTGGLDRDLLPAGAPVLDDCLQVGAIHELHDDEVRVVADADVEDLNTVRVRQMRTGPRLVEEHADELLLFGEVREDALDRDDLLEPLEARALGAVDLGHTASGDSLDDSIALLLLRHRYDSRTTGQVIVLPAGRSRRAPPHTRLPPAVARAFARDVPRVTAPFTSCEISRKPSPRSLAGAFSVSPSSGTGSSLRSPSGP